MGVSIDIHKYNVGKIAQWVKKNLETFEMEPQEEISVLTKVKMLAEAYDADVDSTGDFVLLWNEYFEEYNAAVNFQHDVERLFGFHDGTKEDGSYVCTSMFPYDFGDSNRDPLGDEEWEEVFGFIPKPVDEDTEMW